MESGKKKPDDPGHSRKDRKDAEIRVSLAHCDEWAPFECSAIKERWNKLNKWWRGEKKGSEQHVSHSHGESTFCTQKPCHAQHHTVVRHYKFCTTEQAIKMQTSTGTIQLHWDCKKPQVASLFVVLPPSLLLFFLFFFFCSKKPPKQDSKVGH